MCLLFISWQLDHFWLRYSKFHISRSRSWRKLTKIYSGNLKVRANNCAKKQINPKSCSKVITWKRICGRRQLRQHTNQYKNIKSPPGKRGYLFISPPWDRWHIPQINDMPKKWHASHCLPQLLYHCNIQRLSIIFISYISYKKYGHQNYINCYTDSFSYHDDIIKWKHFPRNWPFVQGIHRPGDFPTQRPVMWSFDVFFDLRLNKRLSKQPWGWWFEMPLWSLWRQCNAISGIIWVSSKGQNSPESHRIDVWPIADA